MKVINFLQNIIKNYVQDKNIIENVYITPKKNSAYPYCLIKISSIENDEKINKNGYKCKVCIDLYDKNIFNTQIINFSQEINNNINDLINNQDDNFIIKYIKFKNLNINIFNEINIVWNLDINFEFLVDCI